MTMKYPMPIQRVFSGLLLLAGLLLSAQAWAIGTIEITQGSENAYPGQLVELTVTEPSPADVQFYRWFRLGSDGVTWNQIPGENGSAYTPTLNAPGLFTFKAETTVQGVREDTVPVTVSVAYTDPAVTVNSIKVNGTDKGSVNVEAYSGDQVEIKVTGSDVDNGPGNESTGLTYAWTQDAGPTVQPLAGASSDTLSFTAPTVTEPQQLLFKITVTDDETASFRGTVTQDVVLTIKPRTKPVARPVIKSGTTEITVPVLVDPSGHDTNNNPVTFTLDGTASSDQDGGSIQTYQWTKAVGTGSDPADPAGATTTFTTGPVSGDALFSYDLVVTDDEGQASDPVRVTLQVTPYQAPELEVSQTANVIFDDQTVTISVTKAIDPDQGNVTIDWTLNDGSPLSSLQNGTLTVAADKRSAVFRPNPMTPADDNRVFGFKVTVTDDDNATNSSVSRDVYITVQDKGRLPAASITVDPDGAQPDANGKYLERHVIHLNGGTSTVNHPACAGIPLIYQWELVTSAAVTVLSPSDFGVDDEGGKKFWFEARVPAPEGVVTAKLTVRDCQGQQDTTSQDLVVLDDGNNAPPIAKAGNDRSVRPGEAFVLDGQNSSDPDGAGDIASYKWEQIGGLKIGLRDSDKATASGVAPNKEDTLRFKLTVTDKSGATSEDTVVVNVAETNLPPVAKASSNPELAPSGSLVNLVGSDSSDPEGGSLQYKWVQVAGASVTINNFSSANASFTAPSGPQGLEFELTVTDDQGAKSTARTVVNVGSGVPPVADAGGDQEVFEGETVQLNGRGSDPDAADPSNPGLSYSWRLAGGPDVVLDKPGEAVTSFVAPAVSSTKTVTLELMVTDQTGFKDVDRVNITVKDNGITGFGGGFVTRKPLLDDNVIGGQNNAIGFKVIDGELVSLRAVPVSEYKDTEGKPEILPFGMWEYRLKGANPRLVIKLSSAADNGSKWFSLKDGKWSEFKDENGNAPSFNDARDEVTLNLRDGGSTDQGGQNTDGFVTGTVGVGTPGVGTRVTGGRAALGGGGALGLPMLVLLMAGLGWRRRMAR